MPPFWRTAPCWHATALVWEVSASQKGCSAKSSTKCCNWPITIMHNAEQQSVP